MTTALIGTATDRNTAMSNRNDSTTTAPMTSERRVEYWCDASIPAAVIPPTSASAPLPATARGRTSARRCWTRSCVSCACGDVDGTTLITAVSPRGLNRSDEHTSELQSLTNLVCRLLL